MLRALVFASRSQVSNPLTESVLYYLPVFWRRQYAHTPIVNQTDATLVLYPSFSLPFQCPRGSTTQSASAPYIEPSDENQQFSLFTAARRVIVEHQQCFGV
ncbi:hypothetical protein VTN77DRAFT_6382 [Rasamsonia byssochlamydoides]|uniref:uncharacterized protein n=1 Tax=Rasamsonia byssochlamydoides TaxID=89139 RepID=UPI0037449C92